MLQQRSVEHQTRRKISLAAPGHDENVRASGRVTGINIFTNIRAALMPDSAAIFSTWFGNALLVNSVAGDVTPKTRNKQHGSLTSRDETREYKKKQPNWNPDSLRGVAESVAGHRWLDLSRNFSYLAFLRNGASLIRDFSVQRARQSSKCYESASLRGRKDT
jgi:hypothetical protein